MAGLRIHVERAIRRIREFKYLAPHACTDTHLIDTVDDAVNLVCGLVNLQGSLIKLMQRIQYFVFQSDNSFGPIADFQNFSALFISFSTYCLSYGISKMLKDLVFSKS